MEKLQPVPFGTAEVFDMMTGRLWVTTLKCAPEGQGYHAEISVREYKGPFELCNSAESGARQTVTHRFDADGLNEVVPCRSVVDTCALWAVPLSKMGAHVIRSGKPVNSLTMLAENCSGRELSCVADDDTIFACMRGEPPSGCEPYDMTASEITVEEEAERPAGQIPPTVVLEAPEPREESAETGVAMSVCVVCKKEGKLMVCAGCNFVHYCSKACQKNDWSDHKKHCRAFQVDRRGPMEPDIEPVPPSSPPAAPLPRGDEAKKAEDVPPDRIVFDLDSIPDNLRGVKIVDILRNVVSSGATLEEARWLLNQLIKGTLVYTDHSPRYVMRGVAQYVDGCLDDPCRMAPTYQDYFSAKYGMPRDLVGLDRLMVRCVKSRGSERSALYYLKFGSAADAAVMPGGTVMRKRDVDRHIKFLAMASDKFILLQAYRPPRVNVVLAAARGFDAKGVPPNWDPGHYGFYVNADGSPVPPDLGVLKRSPHGWLHLFKEVPGFTKWRDELYEWVNVSGKDRVRARALGAKGPTTFALPWHYRRAFAELVFRRDKEELGAVQMPDRPPILRMGGGYGALATVRSVGEWSGRPRYAWRRAGLDIVYTGIIAFDDF